MHEADPRGFLLLNGRPVDDGLLASLCSMDPRQCRRLVAELEAANIFSRQNGCIFSRKMVRDTERELRAKEHGKSGGNPNIVKDLDGPTLKGSLNPSLKGRVNGGLNPNGIWPLQEKTYQDRALDAGGCSDLDGEAPFGRGAA
jgi:hypothetical protein